MLLGGGQAPVRRCWAFCHSVRSAGLFVQRCGRTVPAYLAPSRKNSRMV